MNMQVSHVKHDLTKYKFTCTKWFLMPNDSMCTHQSMLPGNVAKLDYATAAV